MISKLDELRRQQRLSSRIDLDCDKLSRLPTVPFGSPSDCNLILLHILLPYRSSFRCQMSSDAEYQWYKVEEEIIVHIMV